MYKITSFFIINPSFNPKGIIMGLERTKQKHAAAMGRGKMFVVLALAVLFVFGLWTVDIGASAMLTGISVGTIFSTRSGIIQYHIGIVLLLVSFLALAFMVIHDSHP